MNRTKGILLAAGALLLIAVLLNRGHSEKPPLKSPPGPSQQGSVLLNTQSSFQYLLANGVRDVFLDISLNGQDPPSATKNKTPINMGLVIDRSGSMAGQKLDHAKEAARTLVRSLRNGDRIAIITYGSDVSTLVASTMISETTRGKILASIDEIVDQGGTYLSGGLEVGRQAVLRYGHQGMINRVVLISDGQANEGTTSIGELANLARQTLGMGVHLTTMGVGLDFNEKVMTAMAEHGGGHYYFIQNSAAMASIFAQELETMLTTVARNATLKLELEPGVELVELFGYVYQQQGQEVSIKLPDLYGGQQQKVICQLRAVVGNETEKKVAKVKLIYQDLLNGEITQEHLSTAMVKVSTDQDQVERSKNLSVLAKVQQVNISKSLHQAMEAYEQGDVTAAQANLQAQIQASESANAEIQDPLLDATIGKLKQRLRSARRAKPASSAGRALLKGSRYDSYKWAK